LLHFTHVDGIGVSTALSQGDGHGDVEVISLATQLLTLLAVLVPPPSCTRERTGVFVGTLVSYNSIAAGISTTTLGAWTFVLAALIAS
jgi:hypothetical protein